MGLSEGGETEAEQTWMPKGWRMTREMGLGERSRTALAAQAARHR